MEISVHKCSLSCNLNERKIFFMRDYSIDAGSCEKSSETERIGFQRGGARGTVTRLLD